MPSTAPDSTRRIRRVLSARSPGASRAPYNSFNLGTHVGDDADAVAQNRARLANAIGVPGSNLVWMEQVHGRGVEIISTPQREPVPMVDALVSNTPGIALNVLTADCVPVLLWEDESGVIGAAHVGRRGVRLGVVRATIEQMCQLGARPERIDALLGPAICGPCYEVPPTMQADVEAAAPGSACVTRRGTPGLDLPAGVVAQLTAAGVSRVQRDHRCTAEDDGLFSYRRDGRTGRQTAVIWIEERR
ncbi:MAG: peptidoglycan editing factor PgeF [Cumulibacter sp.]